MPKVTVFFTLDSTIEKQQFCGVGIWKDNTLLFQDKQKQYHRVEIQSQCIRYTKRGASKLDFSFEENHHHMGYYTIADIKMVFDVITTRLRIDEGLIEVIYQLKQEDKVVNDVSLKIEFSQVKEG